MAPKAQKPKPSDANSRNGSATQHMPEILRVEQRNLSAILLYPSVSYWPDPTSHQLTGDTGKSRLLTRVTPSKLLCRVRTEDRSKR